MHHRNAVEIHWRRGGAHVRPVAHVFFVSEADYPLLQGACPGEFPATYAQYLKRVDDGIASLANSVHAQRVRVTVTDFLLWCVETKREPDNRTRAEYAVYTAEKSSLS
jgi:hypothetical protein